jgi:hypothetical protein
VFSDLLLSENFQSIEIKNILVLIDSNFVQVEASVHKVKHNARFFSAQGNTMYVHVDKLNAAIGSMLVCNSTTILG